MRNTHHRVFAICVCLLIVRFAAVSAAPCTSPTQGTCTSGGVYTLIPGITAPVELDCVALAGATTGQCITAISVGCVINGQCANTTVPVSGLNYVLLGQYACVSGQCIATTYSSSSSTGSRNTVSSSSGSNAVGGGVVGDPVFVGLRGQSYQIHGVDGAYYNLISEQNMQMNAQFLFLSQGKCPLFSRHKTTIITEHEAEEADEAEDTAETHQVLAAHNCWSHPGSYVHSIGLQQMIDHEIIKILIISGSAEKGFANISVNGIELKLGQSYLKIDKSDENHYNNIYLQVNYTHTHLIKIITPLFVFEFDNSDLFINQKFNIKPFINILDYKPHGLLGQTWRKHIYNGNTIKYIEGEPDDYAIMTPTNVYAKVKYYYNLDTHPLFGTEFMYNQFQNL